LISFENYILNSPN